MLKKMRRRMILSSMIAFFTAMAIIVALINIINYLSMTNSTDDLLNDILEFEMTGRFSRTPEQDSLFPDFSDNQRQNRFFMDSVFTVRYAGSNVPDYDFSRYHGSIDQNEVSEIVERAYTSASDKGYIDIFRYVKGQTEEDVVIIFLNVSKDQDYMRSLLQFTLMIFMASLLLVFFLVFLLSKRTIRPFVQNMEQQKQFITDAGHELKTPLTSISTSLDVLMLEHEKDEWISNIRLQTDQMIQIVGDLVTLSGLDESSAVLEKETFSLSETVWEAVEGFSPAVKALGKKISADIADNITISGNRLSIQKMLSALLDNAARYSGENGRINIILRKQASHAELIISNTCHFDTPPDTDKLFERFYRPDESRSKDTGGTGIGLAIAKAAALSNSGTISASCPDGKTMTIKVVFSRLR